MWETFPDTIIVTDERALKAHAAYVAAKTGDVRAAVELSAAFASDAVVERVRTLLAGRPALIAPVHAMEDQGINRIPAAFGELLADRLGLAVAEDIVQANVVSHTGKSGWGRLARPPVFEGPVHAGRDYLLVDDFVGQGGTLANLRGHIIFSGGRAAGAATLTGRGYSAKLALDPETLQLLREKHEPALETWWKKTFGYGFDCLTESEARYLLRAEDADTIRAKLLAAGS